MPTLIKKVEGLILDNFESDVRLITSVEGFYGPNDGVCGFLDYVNIPSFEAYLQDFSRAEVVEVLTTPPSFGLKNNTDFETIEISY